MKYRALACLLLAIAITACNHKHEETKDEHDHEEPKLQFTAYNSDYELFIETDPFFTGTSVNVLTHISTIPDFRAFENGAVKLKLITGNNVTEQTLDSPVRKGIFSFDIKPVALGESRLVFEIIKNDKTSTLEIAGISVFKTEEEAHEAAEHEEHPMTNAVVFTKEQSWKVDFATELPTKIPFGQIIKTPAQVEAAQGDEIIVTALTGGIINYSGNILTEGKNIIEGQSLLHITGSAMADKNSAVIYAESKNNYDKSRQEYERLKLLAEDKIVSEKELLSAKTQYENNKAIYENLQKNFGSSGQNVKSPMNGFIGVIFVKNGQFVEAGQPLLSIVQNKNLLIKAEVRQRYAPYLSSISTAVIKTTNGKTITLGELNGKILSIGQSLESDNYLIPVSLQVKNNGDFIPGEFVELFLKTDSGTQSLTIPNEALLEDQGSFFIFVQVTPELFEKREISIGATDGLRTEINGRLSEEERIVTKGAILVKLSQSSGALDPHAGHVH